MVVQLIKIDSLILLTKVVLLNHGRHLPMKNDFFL